MNKKYLESIFSYYVPNQSKRMLSKIDVPISLIVPTRNRCPYPPDSKNNKRNPIKWLFDSLYRQKYVNIGEVILVDDYSDDYTKEFVDYSTLNDGKFTITYLRNPEKLDLALSRQKAADVAKNDILVSVDDDSVLKPYTLRMSLGAYLQLEKKNKVGALNMPVYTWSTIPKKILVKNQISVLDIKNGNQSCDADAFPLEYIYNSKGNILDNEQTFNPIEVGNFNGQFIIRKSILDKIGGFPNFSIRSHASEAELAAVLSDNKYSQYLFVEPDAGIYHNRYGRKPSHILIGPDWLENTDFSIKNMFQESSIQRNDTGCSIDPNIIAYVRIRNYGFVFRRNEDGQKKWLDRVYSNFVINNNMPSFPKINNINTRKAVFNIAKDHITSAQNLDLNQNYVLKEIKKYSNVEHDYKNSPARNFTLLQGI